MIRFVRDWRARRAQKRTAMDEPSPAGREIDRQARRHDAIRAIAAREIDKRTFLEPALFPERRNRGTR